MKARWLLVIVWATCLVAQPVDARSRRKAKRRKPAAAQVASQKTTVAVERLLTPFKWGMTPQQVIKVLQNDMRKGYAKPLKAASNDPIAYDRVRRDMMGALKKVEQSHVKFEGRRVPWDVSMVEREYAHKNNEAMIVRWTSDDRRFYFFHNERLWKIFIAFNAEMFEGKTFNDFAEVMETRFGRAEQKFAATIKGDAKMAYLAWPPSKTTILRALDNTKIYGNFCLILMDKLELPRVMEGRRMNSPGKKSGDPLVDAVLKDQGTVGGQENDDIVDQITGRGSQVPVATDGSEDSASSGSSGSSSSSSSTESSPPPKRKRKKLDANNPLDGIDL